MRLKFKLTTKFGTIPDLRRATDLVVYFERSDGDILEKRSVNILDVDNAIGEILLSDFEVQGLRLGKGLTFLMEYVSDGRKFKARFPSAYTVEEKEGRKLIYEH